MAAEDSQQKNTQRISPDFPGLLPFGDFVYSCERFWTLSKIQEGIVQNDNLLVPYSMDPRTIDLGPLKANPETIRFNFNLDEDKDRYMWQSNAVLTERGAHTEDTHIFMCWAPGTKSISNYTIVRCRPDHELVVKNTHAGYKFFVSGSITPLVWYNEGAMNAGGTSWVRLGDGATGTFEENPSVAIV